MKAQEFSVPQYIPPQYADVDYIKSTRLYYVDKKTQEYKKLYDNISRDSSIIKRANDSTKTLPMKARALLTNIARMINESPHKEIFIDHDYMKAINEIRSATQNKRIFAQLGDIFEYKYHHFIRFHGVKKMYGYVVKFTKDGEQRILNPQSFYSDTNASNVELDAQKCSPDLYKNVHLTTHKCTPQLKTIRTIIKEDNLDVKSQASISESILNLVEEEKEVESTKLVASTDFNDTTCNLTKFCPISQRVADKINAKAGRSFSRRFINMRIESMHEKYKGIDKGVCANEHKFIAYMTTVIKGEKITEAVANNPSFEFKVTPVTTTDAPEVRETAKYEDIEQSTTLGKIQARAFKQYGEAVYHSWFKQLLTATECDKRIVIDCGNSFKATWLKQHYYQVIASSFKSRPFISVKDTQLVITLNEASTVTKQEPVIHITKSDISTHNNVVKIPLMLTKFIKTMDDEEKQHEIIEKQKPKTEDEILAEIAELFNNN